MSSMVVLITPPPLKSNLSPPFSSDRRRFFHLSRFYVNLSRRVLSVQSKRLDLLPHFRIKSFQHENAENPDDTDNCDAAKSIGNPDKQDIIIDELFVDQEKTTSGTGSGFLAKLAIALGIAATVTILSVYLKQPNQGPSLEIQYLADGSSSSTLAAPNVFSFKAFGYRIVLPEYAPGWIYFWLLMAAGFGLFISEEALNIWVGISLARSLTLDGTWLSFAESFSRNASYIISTILWVYWGVCISDMVPFYIGKLFRTSGAANDVYSKLGIGKDKAVSITRTVRRYGNLIGFVERFSLGVRNPTAFLAGALGISPEYFFAGVCCGGLITLPLQLGIGVLLRERPVFALATVATVVGMWTVFPYLLAAATALFFYIRRGYSG